MKSEIIDFHSISDREYLKISADFPDIAERVENFSDEDKKRTLAGRFLLKRMITEMYGEKKLNFTYNDCGKPQLDFCFFSISHSGNYSVCAVDDNPVGIDIEQIKNFKKRDKYMLFSPLEAEFVNETSFAERFFTLWTRKESYIKLMGGKLSDASEINLVTPELTLKNEYNRIRFETIIIDGYILSTAENA